MTLSALPTVNATLNAISLTLLLTGYYYIKRRRILAHRRCMIAAFGVSTAFLISYLTYRFAVGDKSFGGRGWIRPVYLSILFSHVFLAALVPFLAGRTLWLGLRGRFDLHRRWARWTFPIWIYVSITGIIVYVLLFRVYGPAEGPR
jgi:uncharacterized membrane protein YozB (DUF420 family)